MLPIPSTRALPALLGLLLLATACAKRDKQDDVTPQAPLQGQWLQGESSYRSFDSKGAVTLSAYTAAPNPACYITLTDSLWQESGQLHHQYVYSRKDSVLTQTFYFNGSNGPNSLVERFYIQQLTLNRLVLRQTKTYSDGTRAIDVQTYSR